MSLEKQLVDRSGNQCELCSSTNNLKVYEIPPNPQKRIEEIIHVCTKCQLQLDKKEELEGAHWSCLNESMWSEVPGVQVVAWRMLNRLKNESWAMDALDMMYSSPSDEDGLTASKILFNTDCSKSTYLLWKLVIMLELIR